MIVTVNSQFLAQALRSVCKVVPSQPAIQILGYVLIEASEELRFSATDLEVSLSLTCPATIQAAGSCVLPAATLMSLVDQFTEGNVTLLSDAKGASVKHGTFTSRLQTLSAAEFPMLAAPEGEAAVLPGAALARLITSTRYAVADRGKKFVLEGALLKLAGTSMGMIATDGARLSIATAVREEGPDVAVIIPRKTLDVLPILGNGSIELLVGPNHLFFSTDGMTLTSRMIEGKFPGYERIIPRDNDKTVTIDRIRLASALKRIGIASEKNCAAYCSIGTDALRLSSKSVEVGEADEQMPAHYDGPPLTVCINWRYMLDFLDVAEGQTVTIGMKSEKSPLLVSDGVSFINVIMTMRG